MTTYRHTQPGYPMIIITTVIAVFFACFYIAAVTSQPDWDPGRVGLVVLLSFLGLLSTFCWLTVEIAEAYLRIQFGWGIFQKKFALAEIASATTVRNKWYYGWGIRLLLWPTIWIYNISGLDAVELKMKNGKIYRIGTDEPDILAAAIKQRLSSS